MVSKNEFHITSIVNYLRKSRRDEDRERKTGEDTLTEQKRLMERVLNEMGIPYEQRYEIGSGDKISTRPIFQQVITELEGKKFDAIAVKEISRLGRGSYTDMGQIYDLIQHRNIYIITPYKTYDPKNPNDLRQIRFELFLSREEFETIRERLVGARYNYAMQGKWMPSKAPIGYRINKSTQTLVVDTEKSKIVKMMFNLYLNGLDGRNMGTRAIATYFDSLKIPTASGKGKWTSDKIQNILENYAYIGQVRYRMTRTVKGKREARSANEHIIAHDAHDAIIDESNFYDVQKKLKNAYKKYAPKVRLDYKVNSLTGLITCGECGKKMIVANNNDKYMDKKGNEKIYNKKFIKCKTIGCGAVKYDFVEEKVLDFMNHIETLKEETLALLISEMKDSTEINNFSIDEIEQTRKVQLQELNKRLEFIFEKFESGVYSDKEFLERKEQIQKELSKLENTKIEYTHNKINETPISPKKVIDIIKNYKLQCELLNEKNDDNAINQILHLLFSKIILYRISKGSKTESPKIKLQVMLNYNHFYAEGADVN